MELTIHAYGYAETIFHTLNSLAMFRNSNFYPTMINTVALLVGLFYALKIAAGSAGDQWRQYLKQVFGMLFLINALLMPKTSMNVKDHVEKHFWRVDNIPLAFALPVGIVEDLGHIITTGFEQAYSLVGGRSSFNYYHHGTVFGARLGKEVMQAKVRDPEFVSNMRHFIERCVILPAMIGQQFTKEELVATKDMWGLVSKKAGTFTRTPMIIGGVRQKPSPTCKQSIPYFEKKMAASGRADITGMSWKFQAAGEAQGYNPNSRQLNQNIKEQIAALYHSDVGVEDILKHNMMINSMNTYRSGKYPTAKAMMQYEAGGLLSADMAEHLLTGWLAVMKNLFYGCFIFLVPLMLITGGMGKYRSWITMCLSLQLWPALSAMLNMLIDYAYQPAKIVSYSAWSTELHKFDSMASVAANLTLIIPLLAMWVTRMGEGGMMHLAGSMMATANAATAAASSEKTSGGMSYDNESIGNSSRNNVSSNKHDDSQQYVSGTNSGINSDGSMEKILPNGQVITVGGAGTTSSTGEANYRESEGVTTALHEGQREEVQAMHSTSAALTTAKESMVSKEASALSTIAENTRTDTGYSVDTSTDEGREVVQSLNAIDRMTESNDYTWQQNAETYLKADISLPVAGKIASFLGLGVGVTGQVGASNGSHQSDLSVSEITDDSNTSNRTGVSTRTNDNSAYLESVGIDKHQQDSMRESYNETARLESAVNVHKDNIDAYSQALDHTKTNGSDFSKDMTQDVVKAYKEKHGVSDNVAAREVLSGSGKAKNVFKEVAGVHAAQILQQVRGAGDKITNTDSVGDFNNKHQDAINQNPGGAGGVVANFVAENGMVNKKQAPEIIEQDHTSLKNKHSTRVDTANENYDAKHNVNASQYEARQEVMEEHSKNRIGKGKLSTLGGLFDGVGRPEESFVSSNPAPKDASMIKAIKPAPEQEFSELDAQKVLDQFKPPSNANSKNVLVDNGQTVDRSKKG